MVYVNVKKTCNQPGRLNRKSNRNSRLRALVAVELKSYVAILAPPKQKNNHAAVELNLFFFLTSLLQCTSIYKFAL